MKNVDRIYLIDDDPICHLISTRIITRFSSMDVHAFTEPIEAMNQLTWLASNEPEKFPDYILLDIDMPLMDGWQFLDEFQKLPPTVLQKSSVMILSSSLHYMDVEKSRKYSFVKDFFSKPLSEEILKRVTQSRNCA